MSIVRKVHRVMSILFCICLTLSCMSITAFAADGAACETTDCMGTYTNGLCSADSNHYESAKDSDQDGVYEIGNAGQLYWFAAQVNGGNNTLNTVLTADIVVNGGTVSADSADAMAWIPIGNNLVSYSGTFDGDGHSVSGLFFNDSTVNYVGLFGSLSGTVKNVRLENSYISGKNYVGGIAGNSTGSVINCANDSQVVGTQRVGGIAGNASNGSFENCSVTASVTINAPSTAYGGGIVGYASNISVKKCFNSGAVASTGGKYVGGIIGDAASVSVENSYNISTVSGGQYTGGVAGRVDSGSTLTSCFNIGSVTGSSTYAAGVAGHNNNGTIAHCYYLTGCAQNGSGKVQFGTGSNSTSGTTKDKADQTTPKEAAQFASGEVAYQLQESQTDQTAQVWYQTIGTDTYPVLDNAKSIVYFGYTECGQDAPYNNERTATRVQPEHSYANGICSDCGEKEHLFDSNGFCTEEGCGAYQRPEINEDGAFEIGNAGQLYWFAELVNSGENEYPAKDNGDVFDAVLTADIVINTGVLDENGALASDTADLRQWTPIGFYVSGSDYLRYSGTFDGRGHTISGLYYYGAYIQNAGLFGYLDSNAVVQNVGLVDSYISAKSNVGGIAGYCIGGSRISNCYNAAQISGATGSTSYIGGIAGYAVGARIEGCSNTGAINGMQYIGGIAGGAWNETAIVNCYNTGSISADDSVGGIVGYVAYESTVTNCYNTGAVTAAEYCAGSVAGYLSTGTVSNCFYLPATAVVVDAVQQYGIGSTGRTDDSFTADSEGVTTSKTVAQFASGEVAYLLNGSTNSGDSPAWYQTIKTDAAPVLDATHGTVYYGYADCNDETAEYTNDSNVFAEKPDHSYEQKKASDQLVQNATCVTAAVYYAKCDVCDAVSDSATVSVGDPKGHNYDDPRIDWTGIHATATYICYDCELGTEGRVVTAENTAEPTEFNPGNCQEFGFTVYTVTFDMFDRTVTSHTTIRGELGSHSNEDGDHNCDRCGELLSECADENKDHKCDTCDEILSECADKNSDYKCDICGAELEKPTDPDDTDPKPSEPTPSEPEEDEPKYELPECGMDDDCVLSQFSDVKIDDWYHDGVHFCVDHGIVNGMGNGTFAPNDPTTRAQLVTMLYRLEGEPSIDGLTEPFTDVSENDWFYAPIVWAYNNKVVNGMTETTFAPDAKITREQVATILHRYLGTPAGSGDLSGYPDADKVQDYAKDALTWAVGEGLINGVAQTDGTSLLAPDGNATRAQIATILMRYLTA